MGAAVFYYNPDNAYHFPPSILFDFTVGFYGIIIASVLMVIFALVVVINDITGWYINATEIIRSLDELASSHVKKGSIDSFLIDFKEMRIIQSELSVDNGAQEFTVIMEKKTQATLV
jgi:hypothetical protein